MLGRPALVLAVSLLAIPVPANAASTILLIDEDAPGEGLNDATPLAPAGGNPAQTLGEARRLALEFAAAVWAEQLRSEISIRVAVDFQPLPGDGTMAVLGRGGAAAVYRDFVGAPRPGTWYPSALADKLAGLDLGDGAPDLRVLFNSSLDGDEVLGTSRFYYGFDGAPPAGDVDFISVALHEMAHGLGFNTYADKETGEKLLGFDDSYLHHLERHGASPSTLAAMTDGERSLAFTSEPELHWTGTAAIAASAGLTAGVGAEGHIEMHAPQGAVADGAGEHFSASLSPDEFMEQFYTSGSVRFGLVLGALNDIGWGTARVCQEGTVP